MTGVFATNLAARLDGEDAYTRALLVSAQVSGLLSVLSDESIPPVRRSRRVGKTLRPGDADADRSVLSDDLLGKPPNGVESSLTITGVNSVVIPGQNSDFRDSESLEFAISVQITNIRRRDVDAERNIGTTVLDPQFRETIDGAG